MHDIDWRYEYMKEERMAVLNMLEKGVISAQEAERLLFALQENPGAEKERLCRAVNKTVEKAGGALNSLAKTLGEQADKLEPKVKRAAEKFTEKASVVVDDAKTYAQKLKEKREQGKDEDWLDLEDEEFDDVEEFFQEDETNPQDAEKQDGEEGVETPADLPQYTKNLESYMNTIQMQMDEINDAENYLKEAFGLTDEESKALNEEEEGSVDKVEKADTPQQPQEEKTEDTEEKE